MNTSDLATLRLSGKRPAGPVVFCDTRDQADHFAGLGLYAIVWRDGEPLDAVRKLWTALYTRRWGEYADRAEALKGAGAERVTVIVKGVTEESDLRREWS